MLRPIYLYIAAAITLTIGLFAAFMMYLDIYYPDTYDHFINTYIPYVIGISIGCIIGAIVYILLWLTPVDPNTPE